MNNINNQEARKLVRQLSSMKTGKEIAKALGISESLWSNWKTEKHTPSNDYVLKIKKMIRIIKQQEEKTKLSVEDQTTEKKDETNVLSFLNHPKTPQSKEMNNIVTELQVMKEIFNNYLTLSYDNEETREEVKNELGKAIKLNSLLAELNEKKKEISKINDEINKIIKNN